MTRSATRSSTRCSRRTPGPASPSRRSSPPVRCTSSARSPRRPRSLRRHPEDRARAHPRDRLRLLGQGLRREDLRRQHRHRRAVARHRAGRGHLARGARRGRGRPARRAGRRRPGVDVRLRHQGHPRTDAAADRAGPPAGAAAHRGPQERRAGVPAAGRQDPGDRPVRRHHPGAPRHRGAVDAARRGHRPGRDR